MNTVKIAVKSYLKLVKPIDEAFSIGAEMDHAICPDGYGTASLWNQYDEETQKLASEVGARFGIGAEELLSAVWAYAHGQQDQFFVSLYPKQAGGAP